MPKNFLTNALSVCVLSLALSSAASASASNRAAVGDSSDRVSSERIVVADSDTDNDTDGVQGDVLIPSAIRFPVIFRTSVDCKTAQSGDVIKAALKEDLKIGDQVIAAAGSILVGHLEEVPAGQARGHGMRSIELRLGNSANKKVVRILFDKIVTAQREYISIVGRASKQKASVNGRGVPREIIVGSDGELERSERVIKSGKQLLAAIPMSARGDRPTAREITDIEPGDELLVQARSPYDDVKVSER
jgi:hypothetical protein